MINKISIKEGCSITTDIVECDYNNGKEILLKEAKSLYSDAFYYKNKIYFQKTSWICPYCLSTNIILSDEEICNDTFEECTQLSLFDNDIKTIYSTQTDSSYYECEHCNYNVIKSDEETNIIISYENNIIKLQHKISNIKELIDCNAFDGDLLEVAKQLPVFQSVIFDFNNHKVFSVIESSNGEPITNIDIDVVFMSYIDKYIEIKNCIHQSLKEIWKPYFFPFEPYEINYDLMLLLTKYVGYTNKDFYFCIPNKLHTNTIFDTFKSIDEKLQYYNNVPSLFNCSRLPNYKSIKRILFSNPQLMYYISEIEKIWDVLGDENFLKEILECGERYYILACLHIFPNLVSFMNDFVKAKSKRIFVDLLVQDASSISSYGLFYISLREEIKDCEKKKWIGRYYLRKMRLYLYSEPHIMFALPMKSLNDNYKKQIREYTFIPIKTLAECRKAGVELDNCLVDYSCSNNPIVVVKRNNKAVAAIEVKGTHVIQAYAKDNEELTEFPVLNDAIEEYYKLCNLKH